MRSPRVLAQLVLQGALRPGPQRPPRCHAASHAVEISNPAAGHPLVAITGDFDRLVIPNRERTGRVPWEPAVGFKSEGDVHTNHTPGRERGVVVPCAVGTAQTRCVRRRTLLPGRCLAGSHVIACVTL